MPPFFVDEMMRRAAAGKKAAGIKIEGPNADIRAEQQAIAQLYAAGNYDEARRREQALRTQIAGRIAEQARTEEFRERVKGYAAESRSSFREKAALSRQGAQAGLRRDVGSAAARAGVQGPAEIAAVAGAESLVARGYLQQLVDFDAQMEAVLMDLSAGRLQDEYHFYQEINMLRYRTDLQKEFEQFSSNLRIREQREAGWLETLGVLGTSIGNLAATIYAPPAMIINYGIQAASGGYAGSRT